jgi:hypothetical protein
MKVEFEMATTGVAQCHEQISKFGIRNESEIAFCTPYMHTGGVQM